MHLYNNHILSVMCHFSITLSSILLHFQCIFIEKLSISKLYSKTSHTETHFFSEIISTILKVMIILINDYIFFLPFSMHNIRFCTECCIKKFQVKNDKSQCLIIKFFPSDQILIILYQLSYHFSPEKK